MDTDLGFPAEVGRGGLAPTCLQRVCLAAPGRTEPWGPERKPLRHLGERARYSTGAALGGCCRGARGRRPTGDSPSFLAGNCGSPPSAPLQRPDGGSVGGSSGGLGCSEVAASSLRDLSWESTGSRVRACTVCTRLHAITHSPGRPAEGPSDLTGEAASSLSPRPLCPHSLCPVSSDTHREAGLRLVGGGPPARAVRTVAHCKVPRPRPVPSAACAPAAWGGGEEGRSPPRLCKYLWSSSGSSWSRTPSSSWPTGSPETPQLGWGRASGHCTVHRLCRHRLCRGPPGLLSEPQAAPGGGTAALTHPDSPALLQPLALSEP